MHSQQFISRRLEPNCSKPTEILTMKVQLAVFLITNPWIHETRDWVESRCHITTLHPPYLLWKGHFVGLWQWRRKPPFLYLFPVCVELSKALVVLCPASVGERTVGTGLIQLLSVSVHMLFPRWRSLASAVTRLWACLFLEGHMFYHHPSESALGIPSPLFNGHRGLFRNVKTVNSPPPSVRVKRACSCASRSQYIFMTWCLVKQSVLYRYLGESCIVHVP